MVARRKLERHIRRRIAYETPARDTTLLLRLLLSDKCTLIVLVDAVLALTEHASDKVPHVSDIVPWSSPSLRQAVYCISLCGSFDIT